jgi:ABC-2 type transport system permease protein
MSTIATLPPPSRAAHARRAWRMLTLTELKLLGRSPAALFWGIGFPVVGLLIVGLIPGTGKPVKSLGGVSVLETYLPIIITFMIIMTSVNFLPATLTSYRERGVLRRMFTTPVTPQALLSAEVAITLGAEVITGAVIAILATVAFTASVKAPLAFIVSFLLLAAAASTLGLLVAAVSFTAKAANALGAVLFFVLLFFSGLWLPRAEMPDWLRGISDGTLTGSGVQAIQNAMAGHWASGLFFGVLAAWIVVCGALAIRFFRWE